MNKKEKESQIQSAEQVEQSEKDLNGLDPEMSILSVNFAPGENPYLNEHSQDDHT